MLADDRSLRVAVRESMGGHALNEPTVVPVLRRY